MHIKVFFDVVKKGLVALKMVFFSSRIDHYGYMGVNVHIQSPVWGSKKNVYIYENCGINAFSKFICKYGKIIIRRNCSVGPGLTVIADNHVYNKIGIIPEGEKWNITSFSDVIVNECVWIGANVTLCPGTIIGRGCIIAAGSVCVRNKKYPPYSIIGGNPANFIKFRLSLYEQIEHEQLIFSAEDRIQSSVLESNFKLFNGN